MMPPTLLQTYRRSISIIRSAQGRSLIPTASNRRRYNDMPIQLSSFLTLPASRSAQPATEIPRFVYGTAWKKERTATLVALALQSGFRGIDTAAQPRHYREDLVGDGIRQLLAEGAIKRADLYIQTKFTSIGGQDSSNLPYDPNSSIPEQVKKSLASSLHNLRPPESMSAETYIDCLVMHSPLRTLSQTLEAWTTLEKLVPHKIHHLGISNVQLPLLEAMYDAATIKPSVVQNRFYPATRFDVPLRRFCREKGIIYQAFWTLTGNPKLVHSKPVDALKKEVGVEREQALYLLVLGLEKLVVLNGTTREETMLADLEAVKRFQQWLEEDGKGMVWEKILADFKTLIGET